MSVSIASPIQSLQDWYVCTWLAGDGSPGLGGDLSTECITGGFLGRIAAEDMLLRVRVGVGEGDGLQEHCKEKSC